MQTDKYGKTDILNIYYDTPNNQLVRTSMEKPVYKEKLRVRSYGVPTKEDTVFVELKKKYKGTVYKRRVGMTLEQSEKFICGKEFPHNNPQIEREISYFLTFYKDIAPAMFLSYERTAMFCTENPALRITFDSSIIYRRQQLDLSKGIFGEKLLEPGVRIMEIKIPNAMPLWLCDILDELKIYTCSYSKYASAYVNELSKKSTERKVTDCA